MRCAKCNEIVRLSSSEERRGSVLWIALISILIVGLAAVSVASTFYAMRTVEERDRARGDFDQSSDTIDEIVVAMAKSGKLKGASAADARQQVFQPAVDHYERIIEKYGEDEQMMPAVASAKLHRAALQAKLGQAECVQSLSDATGTIHKMIKADYSEESFPSFQNSVLKIAEPMDWLTVKGSSPMAQGTGLFVGIQAGKSAYKKLAKRYPESVSFRDDLAELLKSSGLLMGALRRSELALKNWAEARDVLESLVRDQPDNAGFRERLVESLVNAAKLERSEGKTSEAIADYQRAVELRQQMAESNPDDESLAKALARVQRDLESAEKVAAAEKESPEEEESAEDAAQNDESAKQAAKEDAPEKDAGKDDAKQD